MATLAQLQQWRSNLLEARMNGLRRIRDQNGEEVEYRSDSEMARAIAAADREIAALQSGSPPNTIRFKTSKGL